MEFYESIVLLFIVIFSAFIHGSIGFGFPLVATPLIALITDIHTAILSTIIPTMMVNFISIIKGGNWNESIKKHYPLIFYIIAGTLLGSYILFVLPQSILRWLLAITIIIYLQKQKLKFINLEWIKTKPKFARAFFGVASGIISGTTNVMIAVLIIYTNELALGITASIQVMNMCFLSAKSTQLIYFASNGTMQLDFIIHSFLIAFGGVIAIYFGFKIRDKIDEKLYQKILRIFLYLMALLLIIK